MSERCTRKSAENLTNYVVKKANEFSVSSCERKIIERQLDTEPYNVLAVVKRCASGFPRILLVHPFYQGEVFPTIFWLSCPELRERIFALEDGGLLEKITDREAVSSAFSQEMQDAHTEYAHCRRELISGEKWQEAARISEDIIYTLKNSGVGGIRTSSGIKCLHAHFAHYLAGGKNPAGKSTAEALEFPWLCRRCYNL